MAASLTEIESHLQYRLHIFEAWRQKWRMKINTEKSKVFYRDAHCKRTNCIFSFSGEVWEIVDKYKYNQ